MKNIVKKPDTKQGKLYYSKKETIVMSIANQILTIAILLCLIVFSFNYYSASASIEGTSMWPTYNVGYYESSNNKDIAYYSKYASYDRGDVVIPDRIDQYGERFLIKRLIAKGGDRVEFIDNQLYINGNKINETYIESVDKNSSVVNDIIKCISKWDYQNSFTTQNMEVDHISFVVKKGYVFYLGDHRGGSLDCAQYGPQPETIIKAKVLFVVPYNQTLIEYLWTSFLGLFK